MSPFSLLLLVGTCSAFLDFDKVDDGVDHWPSLTSVFPPLRRSSFQRSPNAQLFHNSAWDLPIRPMLQPQPTFLWNPHNSGAHSAFFGFSDSPFKNLVSPRPFPPFHNLRNAFTPNLLNRNKQDLDFFNHELDLDHVSDIISPLLNFFNNYMDSSIDFDFVLSIEGASPEDDDSTIGTVKLDPSMEEDTSQRNINLDDILDEIFEGDDIEMMDPNVDKDFGSTNVNLSKDIDKDYEDEIIDTVVIGNATLPHSHFDDILGEIFKSQEDDDSTIGTEKLDLSMEEDTRQWNGNLDDILDEIFEGDDIEMMDPNVDQDFDTQKFNLTKDMEEDYEDEVIDNSGIENDRLPHTHFDDILEEIFENDNEIKNARQSQDESSNSTEENIGNEFEPTIILFR